MMRRMIYRASVSTRQQTHIACKGRGREHRTHLARARLRQVADDEDPLRRRERPDHLAHLQRELLRERARGLVRRARVGVVGELGLERDEGVDGLAREFVGGAYDGGLGDAFVQDEGGFDLGG